MVERQAKLGVSAEESKTERLKRQQARFRDRGGAFVPSTTNPLVDILLARTVSGESPSKGRPKNVSAKRPSPRKPRQRSPTRKAGPATPNVATSSKSDLPSSRKRKAKAVEPQDLVTKPPAKRRGMAKSRKKIPDPVSDTEKPVPVDIKPKPTSKRKSKQATSSTSGGDPKPKPKAKPKTKKSSAKQVMEVLASDDDQTLVEVPHKAKSNPKRNVQYEEDGETDDDAPIVRKLAISRTSAPKASGTKTVTRVKTGKTTVAGSPEKKTVEDGERIQDEKCPEKNAKKRLVRRNEDEDDVVTPPAKKGKNSTSAKPKFTVEPEPAPRPIREVEEAENAKGIGKANGRAVSDYDVAEAREDDDNEPLPKHVSKPEKRKKEDNYDDRPRKVVKFSEPGTTHSSSRKLKENQPDKRRERVLKLVAESEADAPHPKLATKPPSRAKTPKGPPREVLDRIKASAARHLRCVDSEPDELDCLS